MTKDKQLSYRHKQTGMTGQLAWETEHEVGIDCQGFTWTGSRQQVSDEWENRQ